MSKDKKWASNQKDQLLVENFRNFMKEGDFSAPKEMNEFVGGLRRGLKRMGAKLTGGHAMGVKDIEERISAASQAYSLLEKAELSRRAYSMIAQKIGKSVKRSELPSDAIDEVEASGKSVPPAMDMILDNVRDVANRPAWYTIGNLVSDVAPFLKEMTKYSEYVSDQGDRDKKMGDQQIVMLGHRIGSVYKAVQEILTQVAQSEDMAEFAKIEKIINSKEFKQMSEFEKDNLLDRMATTKKSFEADLKNIL